MSNSVTSLEVNALSYTKASSNVALAGKLTEEVSHVNSRPLKFLWSLKFPRLPKESEKNTYQKSKIITILIKKMEEAYEMILGCLFFFFIIMLINIGLSIAILCIVI